MPDTKTPRSALAGLVTLKLTISLNGVLPRGASDAGPRQRGDDTPAGACDVGSPAFDSTLGPTAGLNVDRQHEHIWDSVVPTFIHYNIPLIVFGWLAALWL